MEIIKKDSNDNNENQNEMEIGKENEPSSPCYEIGLDPIGWISQNLNLSICLVSNEADCFKASRIISNLKWNLQQTLQEKQFDFEEIINEMFIENVPKWHRISRQIDKINIDRLYLGFETEIAKLENGRILMELMERRLRLKCFLSITLIELTWRRNIMEMEKALSLNDIDNAQELLKKLDDFIEKHFTQSNHHLEQCEESRQKLINLLL